MDQRIEDPALLWAAEKANLSYDRFVAGLTPATIARIRAAYRNRYVYSAPVEESPDQPQPDPQTVEEAAKNRISQAFQAKKCTLPREVRPEEYESLLAEINVISKAERHILAEVVKEEIGRANLAVTRAKLKHFLWWLDGKL